jgi:hypothetical protein
LILLLRCVFYTSLNCNNFFPLFNFSPPKTINKIMKTKSFNQPNRIDAIHCVSSSSISKNLSNPLISVICCLHADRSVSRFRTSNSILPIPIGMLYAVADFSVPEVLLVPEALVVVEPLPACRQTGKPSTQLHNLITLTHF